MKRKTQRGVALVITLVMLALVTLMAVVFLSVSRREKASVGVTADIMTARAMTDSALARAQSEVGARILASANPFNYDLIVSTNFNNPAGFRPGVVSPENVNYDHQAGGALMSAAQQLPWVQNLANLQYDPRPPVFYPTNLTTVRTNDFRFYVDLNRNGFFEDTGFLVEKNATGRFVTNFYVGDPQWIGVLEHPDRPHSESNRFIGRYAFVVVPVGKTLDVNYAHNSAKRLKDDLSVDGFLRNQGVGSWEINLAAFLAALNTNNTAWQAAGNLAYNYNTNILPSSGTAFDDARALLKHRYDGTLSSLAPARAIFNFPDALKNPFTTNGVDYYSDGPLTPQPLGTPDNTVTAGWAGSYNTNGYYDVQELFDVTKTSVGFVNRLTNRATSVLPYDRYTFYRLLSQMGTDSRVQESNKVYFADFQKHYTNRLHLLYQNPTPNGQTNFLPWDVSSAARISFFTSAADRMLRSSLDPLVLTNASLVSTNFILGLTPVRNAFSSTNIQLYHLSAGRNVGPAFYGVTNNEYTAATHRLLQLAANIHDATTVRHLIAGSTNDYPSVFRPVFMRTATNFIIRGYVEETNTLFLNNRWYTIEAAAAGAGLAQNTVLSNINVYGAPMVIGAKKGYPSFNKLVVQTLADISRRLEIRKPSQNSRPNQTNQMYVIAVTNRFAVEGWNSYQTNFNRNLELRVTGQSEFALHHHAEGSAVEYVPRTSLLQFSNVVTMAQWPGAGAHIATAVPTSFVVPIDTNVTSLPSSIYLTQNGGLVPPITNRFEHSFRVPQWDLRITNQLQYVLIDKSVVPPRIIDFVNLDKLVADVDLTQGAAGNTSSGVVNPFGDSNQPGPTGKGGSLTDNQMWIPTHSTPSNFDTPSQGVLNQIGVAQGVPFIGEGSWANTSGQTDRDTAIQQFKLFMTGGLTNLTWQVPFTPTRRLYLRSSWEANDPLVHYTAEDLTEPITPGSTNALPQPIPYTFPFAKDALLHELNRRFRPWGGSPRKDGGNDPSAYAITLKDPLVQRSDDWQFPSGKFANLGVLGRVHRGTPWQTMYLKSAIDPQTGQPLDRIQWQKWSGSFGTDPTNDWKLLDLFTVAANDNASRGLLSVNQTNLAAWAGVLGGVTVLTNVNTDAAVGPGRPPAYRSMLIHPTSVQLQQIVDGIGFARLQQTNRTFRTLGDVLATPELTSFSPYLNRTAKQYQYGIDDAALERIPQQVLSLLRTDEPRVAVYAFGQALKPAPRSLVTVSTVNPPIFNICTNYQVTGEFSTKTVLRFEEMPPEPLTLSQKPGAPMAQKLHAVVESYSVLQSE